LEFNNKFIMKSILESQRTTVSVAIIVSALVGFLAGGAANSPALAGIFDWLLPSQEAPAVTQVPAPTGGTVNVISEEQQVVALAERATPAVVSIIVTKELPKYERYYVNPFGSNDPFGDFFGNNFLVPQQRQNGTEKRQVGAGSGFLVSAEGLIITNKHVVSDESADYTVVLNDGSKHPAKVLARDPVKDISVVKIEGANFPFLALGNIDEIKIGQTVVAIGNALGEFSNTVSKGVISGMSRSIIAGDGRTSEQLTGVLQTDAAINPGNSGGPLLNLKGEVIGMNTAVAQGAENIGFAIPVDELKKDLEQVKSGKQIVYPFLGVRYMMIDEEIAKANNLPVQEGALVVRGEQRTDLAVVPGGPADKAGVVENDIILKINDVALTTKLALGQALNRYKVGDTVTLTILHKGVEKKVSVKLEERK